MIRQRHIVVIACLLTAGIGAAPARGQDAVGSPLVADLSQDLIAITTGFTGTDVLFFGATRGAGDIIVVVRAPESRVVVRRKARVGGVWINADSLTFDDVPGFYHMAASAPLAELLPLEVREREQIGAERLALRPLTSASAEQIAAFRAALIRNKQRAQLFSDTLGEIRFLENRLFRTQLRLPSNVPTGRYTVVAYLVADGKIVDRSETTLQVRKIGFEAAVFEFANERTAIYGLGAVVIALVAGWFAGVVFRNV